MFTSVPLYLSLESPHRSYAWDCTELVSSEASAPYSWDSLSGRVLRSQQSSLCRIAKSDVAPLSNISLLLAPFLELALELVLEHYL